MLTSEPISRPWENKCMEAFDVYIFSTKEKCNHFGSCKKYFCINKLFLLHSKKKKKKRVTIPMPPPLSLYACALTVPTFPWKIQRTSTKLLTKSNFLFFPLLTGEAPPIPQTSHFTCVWTSDLSSNLHIQSSPPGSPIPPHPPLPHPWGSRQYQNTLLGQPSWNKYTLSRPHTPILTQETSSLQFCSHHPLISNFCTHHSTETALSETTVQPPPPPRLESWQLQGSALRPASRCWQLPAHFQHLPHLSYRPKNFNYKHLYLCLKVCSGHRSMLSSHGQAGSARELVSPGSSSQPTADRIW